MLTSTAENHHSLSNAQELITCRKGIIEHGRKKEKSNAQELITRRKGIIEHGIKKQKYEYVEVLRFERELYNKKLD